MESGAGLLDFPSLAALSFEPPDMQRYPGLPLAWETLGGPEGSTAVLNAANEVAVAAFLAGAIGFDQIHHVNAGILESVLPQPDECTSIDGLIALDTRVRRAASQRVERIAR